MSKRYQITIAAVDGFTVEGESIEDARAKAEERLAWGELNLDSLAWEVTDVFEDEDQ